MAHFEVYTCESDPDLTPRRLRSGLDEITGLFFPWHVLGPGRAALLAAQPPATDAAATADRDA